MVGLPARTHRMARMLVRQRLLTAARTGAKLPLRWLALGDVADPVHLAALSQMARRVPSVTLNQLAYSLTGMDLLPCVPALTVPTAVVGGVRDRLLPLVHSQRIAAELPDLERLVSVPGAGHMGPWEARAVVSGLLAELAERYL
jgi:pimeloyl-ACP methyl ester carboxylesterase